MKLRTLCGSAAALLILPGVGMAEFNYTSAEFNLIIDAEPDNSSVDGDGYGLAGTYTIADSFYIGASFDDYDFDANWDGEVLEFGGGYFHSLDDDLDFVATLSFVDVELSNRNNSFDDDGLQIGGGVRARLSDSIEVDAMLEYVTMDKGDSETGIDLRGRYYFSDGFAIQARATFGSDFDVLAIGIRGEF